MGRDLFAAAPSGRDLFADDVSGVDLFAEEPVEEKGYFGNTFRRIGERATELGGQLVSGIDVAAKEAEEAIPLGGFVFEEGSILPSYKSPEAFKSLSDQGMANVVAEGGERLKGIDFGSVPVHTWDEVKRHFSEEGVASGMGEVLKYAGETGAASIPDMAFAIMNLPGYVLTRSSEIGETRAINKGKSETDLVDIMEAAPFALGSAILERIGGKGIVDVYSEAAEQIGKGALKVVAEKAGKAAATEAGTEFVQEGVLEYVGERFGTDAKMDLGEALERGVAGAVAGGVYGGTAGGAITAVSSPEKRIEDALQAEIDATEFTTTTDEIARKAFDVGRPISTSLDLDQTVNAVVSDISQAQSVEELSDYANKAVEGMITTPEVTTTPVSEMTTSELLNAYPQDELPIAEDVSRGAIEAPTLPTQEAVLPEVIAGPEEGRDLLAEEVAPAVIPAEVAPEPVEPAEIAMDTRAAPVEQAVVEAVTPKPVDHYAKAIKVDESKDSLLTAVAKLGGLDVEAWVAEGIDPEVTRDRKLNNKVFGRPVFRRGSGKTPDGLAELANEYGYGQNLTANDVIDLVRNELSGEPAYTPAGMENQMEIEARERIEEDALRELNYEPSELEEYTQGMSPEQEAAFHASTALDIDVGPETNYEEAYNQLQGVYDDYAQRVGEAGEGGPEFTLKQETEADRQARETGEAEVKAATESTKKAEQAKLKADEDVTDFILTGSDQAADVAAARGQEDIFAAPAKDILPDIITQTKRKYLSSVVKKNGLKKSAPGYDAAYKRLEDKYELDMDEAQANLTFEQFNEINSDSPESINRSAYNVLREEFGLTDGRDVLEKPLSDIRITEDRETEAGDIVQVSRKADKVMADIDERIDNMKLLVRCIGG